MRRDLVLAVMVVLVAIAGALALEDGGSQEPSDAELLAASGASQVPVGTIIAFAGNSIPKGWLLCDGSLKSKKTFANLYGVIGKTYGESGKTFRVPDLRGRVGVGDAQGSNLSQRSIGQAGGAETVTLTIQQMPAHSHEIVAHRNGDGFHGVDEGGGQERVHTQPSGDGQPHENMPPYLVIRYLIKHRPLRIRLCA